MVCLLAEELVFKFTYRDNGASWSRAETLEPDCGFKAQPHHFFAVFLGKATLSLMPWFSHL